MPDELKKLPCTGIPTAGDCLRSQHCRMLGCLAMWLDVPGNYEKYKVSGIKSSRENQS